MQNTEKIWLIAISAITVMPRRIFSFSKGQINYKFTQNLGQRIFYPTFCWW